MLPAPPQVSTLSPGQHAPCPPEAHGQGRVVGDKLGVCSVSVFLEVNVNESVSTPIGHDRTSPFLIKTLTLVNMLLTCELFKPRYG